uniref:Tetratricopeptide repeat protein 21A/21B N-terminal ARM repeat domain-containing protein n=1 Tax=Takifugu rubripes TaxID=31033 RepID=A0A674MCK7_TAKRU
NPSDPGSIQCGSIHWYCFEKFFNHAVTAAVAARRTFGNVPIYSFFHAFGTLMQDQIQKAILELDSIRDSRDVSLCTLIALYYAEKRKKNPDLLWGCNHISPALPNTTHSTKNN